MSVGDGVVFLLRHIDGLLLGGVVGENDGLILGAVDGAIVWSDVGAILYTRIYIFVPLNDYMIYDKNIWETFKSDRNSVIKFTLHTYCWSYSILI